MHRLLKLVCIFVGLIGMYLVSLSAVYLIPNSAIEQHTNKSLEIISLEGHSTTVPSFSYGNVVDNYTSGVVFEHGISKYEAQSILYRALSVNDYPRYWHGYSIWIRPLLLIFDYHNLRYMYMIIIGILFFASTGLIYRKLGVGISLAYFMSLIAINIAIVPLSLQYPPAFIVMMISVSLLCTKWHHWDRNGRIIFFFVVGSVTNFVDFLSAPLITLGFPLVLSYFMEQQFKRESSEASAKQSPILIYIFYSIAWGISYVLTWASKWLTAWPVLHQSPQQTAAAVIVFRLIGNDDYPLDRKEMLLANLNTLFPPESLLIWGVVLVIIVLMLVFLRKRNRLLSNASVLFITLLPFIWYMIFASHSQIHAWMTYRILGVSLFALLAWLLNSIDWQRLTGAPFGVVRTVNPNSQAPGQ